LIRYRRAYELQADNPAYLLAVAEMIVAMGQPAEALTLLEETLLYFDQNAGIRLAAAQVHMLLGQPQQAIQYFHRASLLRPDDLQIREQMGQAQLAAGHPIDAIRTFDALLKDPQAADRDDLRMAMGNANLAANRLEPARNIYIELTRRDRENVQAWLKLGETSWALRDEIGTLTAARYVMKLAPQRPEGFMLAGLVFQNRGQSLEAIEMFEQAAASAPEQSEPQLLRGIALERAGRASDAAKAYAEALRRNPDDPRARQLLAGVTADGRE
jgi:tetratricopeptide (TPR) repeat protein